MKPQFVISSRKCIYENLALEQLFFDQAVIQQSTGILKGIYSILIWESSLSAVIGRFQNPWAEVGLSHLHEKGGVLARRHSGGGAVIHGSGNLNFSVIGTKGSFSLSELLVSLFKTLGIPVSLNKRGDLLLDNKKISGSASRQSKGIELQHCTLLVSLDQTLLRGLLTPNNQRVESSAVSSTPSETGTLCEAGYFYSVDDIIKKFSNHLLALNLIRVKEGEAQGQKTFPKEGKYQTEYDSILNQIKSKSWIYDKTVAFSWKLPFANKSHHCMKLTSVLIFWVIKGAVDHCCEEGSSLDVNFIKGLNQGLKGVGFFSTQMRNSIERISIEFAIDGLVSALDNVWGDYR